MVEVLGDARFLPTHKISFLELFVGLMRGYQKFGYTVDRTPRTVFFCKRRKNSSL